MHFKNWLLKEMAHGFYVRPGTVDITLNGQVYQGINGVDVRIEHWDHHTPEAKALKDKFLSYCNTVPRQDFGGRLDDGKWLVMHPDRFAFDVLPNTSLDQDHIMPDFWKEYVHLIPQQGRNPTPLRSHETRSAAPTPPPPAPDTSSPHTQLQPSESRLAYRNLSERRSGSSRAF